MDFVLGNIAEVDLYLTKTGSAVTEIAASSVTCNIRKEGQTSLTPVTLVQNTNWFELGNGYYFIRFASTLINTLGVFFVTLSSSSFDNFTFEEFTVVPSPTGVLAPPANYCTLSGSIGTVGDTVPQTNRITFRPVSMPLFNGNTIITADPIFTYADANGNFQLNLLQGSILIVEIERTGLRTQITIPTASDANLYDLIPGNS